MIDGSVIGYSLLPQVPLGKYGENDIWEIYKTCVLQKLKKQKNKRIGILNTDGSVSYFSKKEFSVQI